MKKMIMTILGFAVIFTAIFAISAHAETVNVTVTANEGWENATYDPDSFILTNIDEGYSFKMTNRNDAAATANLENNGVQTATIIVIPSAVLYNGINYKITLLKQAVLGNNNTLVQEVIVSEGIPSIGTSGTGNTQIFYNSKGLRRISLPSTITSIANNSFLGCTSLTSIDIPEAVTTLGKQVFSGCSALVSIRFYGENLKEIGEKCFEGTKITSIHLPNSLKTIGIGTFLSNSELKEVTIPPLVTTIGNSMFNGTSKLTSVTFKGYITSFGSTVFNNANSLTSITFEGKNAPTALTSFGTYTGPGITVYYPEDGVGYDEETFRAFFPANKTTFVPVGDATAQTTGTILSLLEIEDGYQVDYQIILAGDVTSSVHIIALYNNETLVAAKRVEADVTSIDFTTDDTITNAKLFVWDALTNLKPLCLFAEKSI